ncbi:LAMI_0C10286g1_1 [Lachancea mirantina]|uniref:Spindle pole component 29 n=1 Tax=Lachancea mirantina TaxID=1230905 RepID=A0A1G4J6E8_9SACH|nr:LAMI_0C10286g1_1 [Lachancea mirantina]
MSKQSFNDFFNKVDTDDTLQNIRKEYLASKKNLHELISASPTRITAKPVVRSTQLPTPPGNINDLERDERLRRQLHDTNQPRQPDTGHSEQFSRLESLIVEQQRQLDRLRYQLDQYEITNRALRERTYAVEHELRQLRYTGSLSIDSYPRRETRTAESRVRDNEIGDLDFDNTKALLSSSRIEKSQRRQFSNLDDSTTRILQMTKNPQEF